MFGALPLTGLVIFAGASLRPSVEPFEASHQDAGEHHATRGASGPHWQPQIHAVAAIGWAAKRPLVPVEGPRFGSSDLPTLGLGLAKACFGCLVGQRRIGLFTRRTSYVGSPRDADALTLQGRHVRLQV
jgi:hypothetical protein